MSNPEPRPGSSSIEQPDYWWYRARTQLLHAVLGEFVGSPSRVLDVGSADGPSVGWMRGAHTRIAMDIDPRGLVAGEGIQGSVERLPFRDEVFDVVAAFDVVEHCADEGRALAEIARVLVPGGRLLAAVPAYQWAWTDHDVRAGHHRRYTQGRLVRAVEASGLQVLRSTYAFSSVFPMFAAERGVRRLRRGPSVDPGLPRVSPSTDRLLVGLCAAEARWLRKHDVPFGSSVFVAAVKPAAASGSRPAPRG